MKLTELMKDYLQEIDCEQSGNLISENARLIQEVKEHITNRWITVRNPDRLHCRFTFSDYFSLTEFVNRVLSYQGLKGHHGKLICDEDVVIIEVYTKDVGDITEMDIAYSEDIMSIYNNLKRKEILDV